MNPLTVFVDSSAFYALTDKDDAHYREAHNFLAGFSGTLVTTDFVVDETITLVLYKLGYQRALKLGDDLWSQRYVELIHVTPADQRAAWSLFKRYQDKMFSFTDCTSFAVMERLGLFYAFTFDEHFEQTGRFVRVPS